MVGVSAAGYRDAHELTRLLARGDGVAGVGGSALGAVHGAGAGERRRPLDDDDQDRRIEEATAAVLSPWRRAEST